MCTACAVTATSGAVSATAGRTHGTDTQRFVSFVRRWPLGRNRVPRHLGWIGVLEESHEHRRPQGARVGPLGELDLHDEPRLSEDGTARRLAAVEGTRAPTQRLE